MRNLLFIFPLFFLTASITKEVQQATYTYVPAQNQVAPIHSAQLPQKRLSRKQKSALLASMAMRSRVRRKAIASLASHAIVLHSDKDVYVQTIKMTVPDDQHQLLEPGQSFYAQVLLEDNRSEVFSFSLVVDREVISQPRILRSIQGKRDVIHLINIPIKRPGFLEAGKTYLITIYARAFGLRKPVRFAMLPLYLEKHAFPQQAQRRTRSF